jgi:hypothetical protein
MRIKAKLKSKKLNTKLFKDLKRLESSIKAGYPENNPKSHEKDLNGDSALYKAYEINFSNKNFIPYLQISYENNIIKYKKSFVKIAKSKVKKQDKEKKKLGEVMVKDIKNTISSIQYTPVSTSRGCIFGAVSFSIDKKAKK